VKKGSRRELTKESHQSTLIPLLEETSETKTREAHEAMLLLPNDGCHMIFGLGGPGTVQISLNILKIDEGQLRWAKDDER
jgi:hypothetical protein